MVSSIGLALLRLLCMNPVVVLVSHCLAVLESLCPLSNGMLIMICIIIIIISSSSSSSSIFYFFIYLFFLYKLLFG